jgi:hypothetical protein
MGLKTGNREWGVGNRFFVSKPGVIPTCKACEQQLHSPQANPHSLHKEIIMSSIYEAKEEMHQIEVQLYPNHLAGGENTYLAKNVKEKTIGVDAICAAMRNRGGYDGSHDGQPFLQGDDVPAMRRVFRKHRLVHD